MDTIDKVIVYPPSLWEDFERLCWDLWREIWQDPNTQFNGRRGQKQQGVDIFGRPKGRTGWAGVQCKLKSPSTTLKIEEIRVEIDQASKFIPPLTELIITTTAPSDVRLQQEVRLLTNERELHGQFPVTLLSWDEICRRLADFPSIVERHFPLLARNRVTDGIHSLPTNYATRIANFLTEYVGSIHQRVPFGGRGAILRDFSNWLDDSDGSPYRLVIAPAGRGKSALLAQWITGLSIRSDLHIVFMPISIRFRTSLSSVVFGSLAARLARLHGDAPPGLTDLSGEAAIGLVSDYLSRPIPGGARLLVVIDGVDEAADWQIGPDLIPLNPWNGLKVVLSARTRAGDVGGQSWLDSLGWTNLGIAHTLMLDELTLEGVAEVVRSAGTPIDTLANRPDVIAELGRLSEGDPLLIRLYLADLRRGPRSIVKRLRAEDLADLSPGLFGYFDRWWREQREVWKRGAKADEPFQEARVRQIFAFLACSLGPLMLNDLLELISLSTPVSRRELRDSLEPLSRFIIGDGVELGFTFSHPRMSSYFREEELTAIERKSCEDRLIQWCEGLFQDAKSGLRRADQLPAYVVQHLGAHLERSNSGSSRLHELISKTWLAAWQPHDSSYAGFLNDVDRAQRAADRDNLRLISEGEKPRQVSTLFRAAACHASINSLASNLPSELLASLVKAGIWSPAHALAYARRMSGGWLMADALATLAPTLPEAVLSSCLGAMSDIEDEQARCESLIAAAPQITPFLVHDYIRAVRNLGNDFAKAEALTSLAPQLSAETSSSAFDLCSAITDEDCLVLSLMALAPKLPEPALEQVLLASSKMSQDRSRVDILISVAPRLSQSLYSSALSVALSVQHERALALAALSRIVPEDLFANHWNLIWSEEQDPNRVKHLATFANCQPAYAAQRLTTCDELPRAEDKLYLLSFVVHELTEEAQLKLIAELVGLAPDEQAAACLFRIAPNVHERCLEYLLNSVQASRYLPNEWATVVCFACADRSEDVCRGLLSDALNHASTIEDENDRGAVLGMLGQVLPPDLMTRYLALLLDIVDVELRSSIVAVVAPSLDQDHRVRAAEGCLDDLVPSQSDFPFIAQGLAPYLPSSRLEDAIAEYIKAGGQMRDALWATSRYVSTSFLWSTLDSIAITSASDLNWLDDLDPSILLPPHLIDRLRTSAYTFFGDYGVGDFVAALANRASTPKHSDLLFDALRAFQRIGDHTSIAPVMCKLAPHLQDVKFSQLVCMLESAADKFQVATLLKSIIPYLPVSEEKRAFELISSIISVEDRCEILASFIAHCSEVTRERAVSELLRVKNKSVTGRIWLDLATTVDVDYSRIIFDDAREFSPIYLAKALVILAQVSKVSVDLAVRTACGISNPSLAAATFLRLTEVFPSESDSAQAYEIATTALDPIAALVTIVMPGTPRPSNDKLESLLSALLGAFVHLPPVDTEQDTATGDDDRSPTEEGDLSLAEEDDFRVRKDFQNVILGAVRQLVSYLPTSYHKSLVTFAGSIRSEYHRAKILTTFFPTLSDELRRLIFREVADIRDDLIRDDAFRGIYLLASDPDDPISTLPFVERSVSGGVERPSSHHLIPFLLRTRRDVIDMDLYHYLQREKIQPYLSDELLGFVFEKRIDESWPRLMDIRTISGIGMDVIRDSSTKRSGFHDIYSAAERHLAALREVTIDHSSNQLERASGNIPAAESSVELAAEYAIVRSACRDACKLPRTLAAETMVSQMRAVRRLGGREGVGKILTAISTAQEWWP
jgi:hypothetical protein